MPKQIRWKFWRAKLHYDELLKELAQYFEADPGEIVEAPESTPEQRVYLFEPKNAIPARFGLIAGDFLQNMRSCLDYLVWQLVISNGKIPAHTNQFPICTGDPGSWSWDEVLKRKRLIGIDSDAIDEIKAVQPCFALRTGRIPHPLAVLE